MEILTRAEFLSRGRVPLAVYRQAPQSTRGIHAHEFSELVLIYRGRARHVTEGEAYPVAAGDVFVITGQRRHGYDRPEDFCLVNVLFDLDALPVPLFDLPSVPGFHALFALEPEFRRQHGFGSRLRLDPAALAAACALVDRLEAELRGARPGHAAMAVALFMQLVTDLARAYGATTVPASQGLLRLGQVLCFLETRLAEPVTLDQLARLAGMSVPTLVRAFRRVTGHSPIQYLIAHRVARAAELLRETDEPVAQVARRVGFDDANYFSRLFRRRHGRTPRAFRAATRVLPV